MYDMNTGNDESQLTIVLQDSLLGEDHQDVAPTLGDMGQVYHCLGEYGKALEVFDKALAICDRVLDIGSLLTESSALFCTLTWQQPRIQWATQRKRSRARDCLFGSTICSELTTNAHNNLLCS
jgi:hypothetical protein